MESVVEPSRQVPVVHEVDVCVLGGSCTGVFAALRAARLGARVALVEKAGGFGGVATLSLVNVWHTNLDEAFEKQIFAGLTLETIERLRRRGAVKDRAKSAHWAWAFNPFELQIELDELVREQKTLKPFLHTLFAAPHVNEHGELDAVIVEDKSGRRAIRAKMFVDATGDADLCHRLGMETYTAAHFQPATTCATVTGWEAANKAKVVEIVRQHGAEFGLTPGFMWGAAIPESDVYMLAGTRIYQKNCADAEALTEAEMEGRRQVRAIMDTARKYLPECPLTLQGLPARIGIRETRHVRCRHQLTGAEVLGGMRFADAVANGSYRVDVHHQDKPGITLKYLDGRQEYCQPGMPNETTRWRAEGGESPTFYQIPYRAMLPKSERFGNVIVAGRMIDADPEAHAAIRVMVNMNQTGEAAGVAAVMGLEGSRGFAGVDVGKLREKLAQGGSLVI